MISQLFYHIIYCIVIDWIENGMLTEMKWKGKVLIEIEKKNIWMFDCDCVWNENVEVWFCVIVWMHCILLHPWEAYWFYKLMYKLELHITFSPS